MRRLSTIAALAVFVVHLIANPHYGYFRDELYFIACGMHPDWGYVDQPPLVPLLAALTQVFGHSLVFLRAVPALFAAGGVAVTCALVIEFGGGPFAQVIAALVFFFTPVLLSFGMKVGTDEAGLFFWPLIALLVVRIARGASPKLWLAVGLVAGLSFESKYSVLFLLAAMFIGVLATPERRTLWGRWVCAGAGIALLVAGRNVVWQLHYGLPMLELLRNGQNEKNGLIFVPWALPILPEQSLIAYAAQVDRLTHLSGKVTATEHGREENLLPADWADMHGWPQMAATVQAVYDRLPPSEQRDAVVFAGNYGEASAVAFFAPGVPVVSEHNQFWLWGPRGFSGSVLVQINGSCFKSDGLFASRTRVATLEDRYAIKAEDNIPVWICRRPRRTLSAIWPEIKTYE
jgi:hypothetical protein